jgi:hypothetical protein
MIDSQFVGIRTSLQINYVQQWTGDILNDIYYVDTHEELADVHNKIVLIEVNEANFHFELTEKLLMQKNYLIFYDFFECAATGNFKDLYRDLLHKFDNYAVIGNAEGYVTLNVNVNEFYFATASEPNRLRGITATDKIYSSTNKPYKFLFLNGRTCEHRIALWKLLEQNDILPESLHSWLGTWRTEPEQVAEKTGRSNIPITLLPSQYENPLLNTGIHALYGDNWYRYRQLKRDLWQHHWVQGHVVPAQYADTYFSLVTETCGEGPVFVTEKTYKPILSAHPFIIAASPGHYAELHRLGFETFSDWVDESFDLEEDLNRRMTMIAQQVQQLCSQDLDKFLSEVKEICLYNQQHYISTQWSQWYNTHIKLKKFFSQALVNLAQLNQQS